MENKTTWESIESKISAATMGEYYNEWGKARQAFYTANGPIELGLADRSRLAGLKNAFWGETIFILGNGPSLNNTPLELLENKYTFCVNRAYLLYERIDWKPTFYTANDWRVVPDNCAEINALTGSIFFFDNNFKGIMREDDDVYFYEHSAGDPKDLDERVFSSDMSKGVRGAGSVVGTAIQIAAHLGFKVINLLGCDLGYYVPDTVTQQGDDKFGNGVKLELTSTKDDDPNHFDTRYFGKNRRWHDPNVKRMLSGHRQCLVGSQKLGISVRNATIGGELEVYDRIAFETAVTQAQDRKPHLMDSLINGEVLSGPFEREQYVNVDESVVVHYFSELSGIKIQHMIDVGAHHGSSLMAFARSGTKVLAFEPDPKNRSFLEKNLTRNAKAIQHEVDIVPMAVSDFKANAIPFYSSEESSGISGLSSFHKTHKVTEFVEVTTISDVLIKKSFGPIDFLKIDVEGHELKVLQGLRGRYSEIKCIVAEFEDGKSVLNGFRTQDMAKFLAEHDFVQYISEWWPIEKYGVTHSFRKLYRLSHYSKVPTGGWGNIIAIKRPYAQAFETVFLRAFQKSLVEKTKAVAEKAASAKSQTTNNLSQDGIPPLAGSTSLASNFKSIGLGKSRFPKKQQKWEFGHKSNFTLNCVFSVSKFPDYSGFDDTSPKMLGVIGNLGIYILASGTLAFLTKEKEYYKILSLEKNKPYQIVVAFSNNELLVAFCGKTLFQIRPFAGRGLNEILFGSGYLNREFSGEIYHLRLANLGDDADVKEI